MLHLCDNTIPSPGPYSVTVTIIALWHHDPISVPKNTFGWGSWAVDRADVSKCMYLLLSLYVIMYIACIPVNMLAVCLCMKRMYEKCVFYSLWLLLGSLCLLNIVLLYLKTPVRLLCVETAVSQRYLVTRIKISDNLRWWRCMLKGYFWVFHLHLAKSYNLDLSLTVYKQTEHFIYNYTLTIEVYHYTPV